MTAKTLPRSAANILQLADSLQAMDGGMIQTQAFYDFLRFQRDVAIKIEENWKLIENFMVANNIRTIKGDWGHATIATKTNLKADQTILTDQSFYKQALDSSKVKNYKELFGNLPEGVTESTSTYLSKRVNPKW